MPLQCKNGQIAYSLPVKDKRATESNAITTTLTYNFKAKRTSDNEIFVQFKL